MIPEAEEREWILDELAGIAAESGWEPLVAAPILLPEPRFFPDRWTPDGFGVLRLARRYHRYFSLDELEPEVDVYRQDDEEIPGIGPITHSAHHEGAAAYFAGIEDGVCLYGVDEAQLADPIAVTAALAHEACHAFRARFELAIRDPEQVQEEECLTDLTTVYLGAGVLTANATEQFASGAMAGGVFEGHQWSVRRLGYLSPESMCFALAVVVALRELDRGERRAIAAALHPNHAKRFRKSLAWIEKEVADLRGRLGVPASRDLWPEPFDLDELTGPLDGEDALAEHEREVRAEHAEQREELARARVRTNEGHPVFRVRAGYDRAGLLMLIMGSMLIGMGGMVVGLLISPTYAFPIGIGAGVATFYGVRGAVRWLAMPSCSNPECMVRLRPGVETCPACGGVIRGTINGPDQRLAAEEAWHEKQALRAGDP